MISDIKKRNGLVYYWTLTNYQRPSGGSVTIDGINYPGGLSGIDLQAVNCSDETFTKLKMSAFSQRNGDGKVLFTVDGDEIPNSFRSGFFQPNTIGWTGMKIACDNAK